MLERIAGKSGLSSRTSRGVLGYERVEPGVESGPSTPKTQYGSFDDPSQDPPSRQSPSPRECTVCRIHDTRPCLISCGGVERAMPSSSLSRGVSPDRSPTTSPTSTVRGTLSPPRRHRDHPRTWSLSTQRTLSKHASHHSLFVPSYTGLAAEIAADDLPPSDDELFESEDGDPNCRRRRQRSEDDQAKQYGVLKMETIARTWGRRGLMILYCG
jgi:hypothetical protein